jgi:hypothetical protein
VFADKIPNLAIFPKKETKKKRKIEIFILEADVEHSLDYSALFPAALEGLFQRSHFSPSRSSPTNRTLSVNFF